ncbi:hypothetical protein N7539_000531 [Penicillium diatomitis]|uniref:Uncharacterized protein n=1 Tax=Penicillium diatomitis TaxID=2819901 RepID=A0A9X0C2R1_9EURO|nr:uncharacterized protein N7539_000531 [Penicillium diatomitis]KAJ5495415.1 hypothetical protein N7539_000531 [Penicillium diatomitis]
MLSLLFGRIHVALLSSIATLSDISDVTIRGNVELLRPFQGSVILWALGNTACGLLGIAGTSIVLPGSAPWYQWLRSKVPTSMAAHQWPSPTMCAKRKRSSGLDSVSVPNLLIHDISYESGNPLVTAVFARSVKSNIWNLADW